MKRFNVQFTVVDMSVANPLKDTWIKDAIIETLSDYWVNEVEIKDITVNEET